MVVGVKRRKEGEEEVGKKDDASYFRPHSTRLSPPPTPSSTSVQFVSSRRPPALAGQQSAELICALRAPIAPRTHLVAIKVASAASALSRVSPSRQRGDEDAGRRQVQDGG